MNDLAENKHKSYIPTRRKLSTISHIHKTFFEEGHESDVKIVAVNRKWNLHRHFLSQSPYFKSIFSSSWVEKKQKEINLGIEDENITAEALHKVLESLYSDEIQVEPTEAVPILACATFLQLNDLIDHCAEVMKVCINKDTAVRFFEAAELYSIEEVKNVAFDWLCRNVWKILNEVHEFPQFFYKMSEDLLKKLLTSSDLCVDEEENVFAILISWTYLKENSSDYNENESQDDWEEIYEGSLEYFCEKYGKGRPFLESDSGISYQSLFHAMRLNNLILYMPSFDEYRIWKNTTNIFPAEWGMPASKTQWCNMLRIHQGSDRGPNSVSEEVFDRECVRISGYIEEEREKNIWSSRNFGFGLGFCYENGSFKIKRNTNSNNSVGPASSNIGKRYLMYRLSLFSADSDGRVLSKAETGIQTVSMAPNDEIEMLSFKPLKDSEFQYRINFLLTTP